MKNKSLLTSAVRLLVIALAAATLLTGCTEKEEKITLYMPVTQKFSGMDPQIAREASSRLVVYNCFEGLTRLGEDGSPVLAGASGHSVSADGLKYTFTLRPDACWYLTESAKEALQDTLPADPDLRVTADDYVFAFRRALDPATGSADGRYLAAIKNGADILAGRKKPSELGVSADDDFTLTITLDYADPDFLYALTRTVAMPCKEEFFNATEGRYGMDMQFLLCNGPYILYNRNNEKSCRLEKNSLYTGTNVPANDTVWLYYTEDTDALRRKMLDETYDLCTVSSGELGDMAKSGSLETEFRNDVLWCYWFNESVPLFADVNMRMAFASCVNPELIPLPEYAAERSDRLLTDSCQPFYEYSPRTIIYDESAAESYYRAAKNAVPENVDPDASVTVLTTDECVEYVRDQIQIWQRVFGMNVMVASTTREEAESALRSGNYEAAMLPLTVITSNTTDYFRMYMTGNAYNITGYMNENYDSVISSVTTGLSEDERITKYKECEQTLIEHAVAVPMFTEASYFVHNSSLTGIRFISDEEIYFTNGVFE